MLPQKNFYRYFLLQFTGEFSRHFLSGSIYIQCPRTRLALSTSDLLSCLMSSGGKFGESSAIPLISSNFSRTSMPQCSASNDCLEGMNAVTRPRAVLSIYVSSAFCCSTCSGIFHSLASFLDPEVT